MAPAPAPYRSALTVLQPLDGVVWACVLAALAAAAAATAAAAAAEAAYSPPSLLRSTSGFSEPWEAALRTVGMLLGENVGRLEQRMGPTR